MSVLLTPVLMYHHIVSEEETLLPPPRHPMSYLSRRELSRQLDWIQGHNLSALTLAEVLEAHHQDPSRLPRRRVVLTFDDGCSCFVRHALPELARRGMRATLFVVTGELGGRNRWDLAQGERQETLASVEELRRLSDAGIETASHSHSHPDLTACSSRDLEREIAGSRQALEAALGVAVKTFCYPYGRFDRRVRDQVRKSGYLGAVSIFGQPDATSKDPFALPRMIVRPGESRFELGLKVRGLYPLWSRLPRLGVLAALRRRGGRS